MDILLQITKKAETYRSGKLYLNGKFLTFTLEDADRGLNSKMTDIQINGIKLHGKTGIPLGSYELQWTLSPRFKKYTWQLMNVKGFAGVRIHSGNTADASEGCILLGLEDSNDGFMGNSKAGVALFEAELKKLPKGEKITLTIRDI